VDELLQRRDWARQAKVADRRDVIDAALAVQHSVERDAWSVERDAPHAREPTVAESEAARFDLVASVFSLEDARIAASAGATTVVLDVFLRHPTPPVTRVKALADELRAQGVTLRLRTPTIVRPEERRTIQKWLDLGLPMVSGHVGLVAELARAGRDVVADYAVNCFNQHTAAELFRLDAGIDIVHVPNKGMNPALIDLLGGSVQLLFASVPGMQAERAQVRAIAMAERKRSALMPELATMDEQGLKGFEVANWAGLLGPAGLDGAIVKKLHDEIVAILATPDMQERIRTLGYDVIGSTPEEFGAQAVQDVARWSAVVKKAGIATN